ncbi:heavy metal translocating P-type ATPase [Shewanella olleyana]|uniref:heavy metal translocating P-type ATPase n=1 Tax=Shewanella olleyana TaxID=135626 RepID=UPI00200E371B|nr:heavy metal translocating P-type ATPase [Shewanella olleyana]MCL1065688.1 heavy metal translocating P-type ATPase [Shewanella olleyana]
MQTCFHCNEPVLTGREFTTVIDNQEQLMCCPGCQAVSQAIIDSGLSSYYQFRSEPGSKQTALVPSELAQYSAYDLPEIQQDLVYSKDDEKTLSVSIEGITCAACAWLIEHKLKQLPGIVKISVNSTTQRALVTWNDSTIKLSEILSAISRIGYQAAPYQVDEQEKLSKQESRKFLLRLGLAGFATMQVMMFALALYSDYFVLQDTEMRDYFRWVSMTLAAPVVFYSAQPFYFSAVRSLLGGKVNMDLSVSLAIAGAYIASCIATINGAGEVYFESVTMFTFFLLLGRFFEQKAKQTASVSSSNLHKLVPLTANLKTIEAHSEINSISESVEVITEIPAKRLIIGDIILIKPGEVVAADGIILQGKSGLNESMLTGEQMPLIKSEQDMVYAGTINVDQPLTVEVTALGQDQLVAEIIRLQEVASNTKPKIALMVDKSASYFSTAIILIAALTYVAWQFISPDDAFWVMLSVLVATCPCALALATPTAITCSTAIFTKLGIIVQKAGVFEKLPLLQHIVFDKTGTLTCGTVSIQKTILTDENISENTQLNNNQNQNSQYDEQTVLNYAAALELGSLHPIAQAFSTFNSKYVVATDITHHVGLGISGKINNKEIKIGNAQFNGLDASHCHGQLLWLSIDDIVTACFVLQDSIRVDSQQAVSDLQQSGLQVSIASGDCAKHVNEIAKQLNIKHAYSGLSPADKLELINKLQTKHHVAMFGDGINDAPVLAGANLSVAMGSGSAIAKNSADLILLGDHLSKFNQAIKLAKLTNRIIKQNLIWAFAYNIIILPLAVTGHVVPYIAAIGMSISSIIVVSNSLRLLRVKI